MESTHWKVSIVMYQSFSVTPVARKRPELCLKVLEKLKLYDLAACKNGVYVSKYLKQDKLIKFLN